MVAQNQGTLYQPEYLDFYDGVQYVKHDKGYNYEEKDLERINASVQERFNHLGNSSPSKNFGEIENDLPKSHTSTIRKGWRRLKRIDFTNRTIVAPSTAAWIELFYNIH